MKTRAQPIVVYSYGSPGHVQFNARMLATLHRRLKVYATVTGLSMSECVNAAITDFLAAHAGPHDKDRTDA